MKLDQVTLRSRAPMRDELLLGDAYAQRLSGFYVRGLDEFVVVGREQHSQVEIHERAMAWSQSAWLSAYVELRTEKSRVVGFANRLPEQLRAVERPFLAKEAVQRCVLMA